MSELDLFAAAIAISDPAQRAAFLDRECAHDLALRQRLQQLLDAHFRSHEFLEPAPNPTASYAPDVAAGALIAGRYKLLQQIGEGGMGTVWMADQIEPVKRRVALKLIRVERAQSKMILSRFEAERQAIALMDHPNIARLLDAGATEGEPGGVSPGSPFFVMELVKGKPLTEFCDEHRLGVPARLALFTQVCSAVQHAHQKGVIHRDLKPTNILVESHDGKPVPKVIDFGLAKATTGLQLTEHTLFTAFGSVMGTPLYMAPEQATFNAVDVDTRADVYALGVILYELLTGATPLTRESIKKAQLDELFRLIREQDAPTPSNRVSTSDSAPSVAANRQTEPAKLGRFLRGELDWIVLKALSKERDRRYETALGFARDLERFLHHEPVAAGPPTARYKLRKFVQRRRGQVVAASLVLLSLLGGIVGTTLGQLRAERARQDAVAAQNAEAERAEGERKARQEAQTAAHAEKLAREQAQKRLVQLEKGNEIITSIFADLDIRRVKAGTEPLEAVLAKRLVTAAEQLEGEAVGDHLVVAGLQDRLGYSLLSLGHAQEAVSLFTKARETRTAELGPNDPDTLTTMNNLAMGYRDLGKLDLALPLHEEVLKRLKARLGPDHPKTLSSMNNLANGYEHAGKMNLALPLYEETLKRRTAALGPDHRSTLASINNLATAYHAAGEFDLALPLFEKALTLQRAVLGPDHLETLTTMNNLASTYQGANKLGLALPLFEETLRRRKARLGPDHPDTLVSMSNLARCYLSAGKVNLAPALFEETLKLQKAKLGPHHPDTLESLAGLAASYHAMGKLDQALPLFQELVTFRKSKLGLDHPSTLESMNNLAEAYHAAGKLDLARPLFEETLKLMKDKLGADHPNTLAGMNNLGEVHQAMGSLNLALPLFQEAAGGMEKRRLQHEYARTIVTNLIGCHEQLNQFDQAETWRRKWLAVVKERSGADPLPYASELAALGLNLLHQKKWTDAEPILRESLAVRQKKTPDDWTTFNTQSLLGAALSGQKKYADAEPLLLRAYEGMKAREKSIPPQRTIRLPEALDRLIDLYTATNKPDQLKRWQAERAKYQPAAQPKTAK